MEVLKIIAYVMGGIVIVGILCYWIVNLINLMLDPTLEDINIHKGSEMKRYIVFGGPYYYPIGGMGDFQGDFDDKEDAFRRAYLIMNHRKYSYEIDWAQVFDSEERKILGFAARYTEDPEKVARAFEGIPDDMKRYGGVGCMAFDDEEGRDSIDEFFAKFEEKIKGYEERMIERGRERKEE